MTSYYRFSEQDRDEAVVKLDAYTVALANLERTGNSEDANYVILAKKLRYGISLNKMVIENYDQQLIQDVCEHEWVEASIYRSYCPKCKCEELTY